MKVESHPLLDRLAADYVLGVMQPNTRRRFAAAIRGSTVVEAAVDAWSERLHLLSRVESDLEASPEVFARIERRIDEGSRPGTVAAAAGASLPGSSWWSWLRPAFAFALGVLLCTAIFVVRGPEYETLTSPGSTAPTPSTQPRQTLHVLFAPQTTMEQANEALRRIDASIVAGPSDLGLLTVTITTEQDLDQTLATLRAQPGVQFAEPVASGRPR